MKKYSKICLIIPSLHAGGMERVMTELASFMASKDNIRVHLVLYGKNPTEFYTLPQNLQLHKPNYTFKDRFRFIFMVKALFFLRHKIKQIRPDSILSFGEYWNSFVLIALLGLKYPVYISDRCQPDKHFSTFHGILRSLLYPRSAGIIAQTSKAREIYLKQFKHKKIIIIGNPLRRIPSVVNIKKENTILTVGRLIQTKNHDRLIRIFSQLHAPDWKLVIVGGNALKQNNLALLQKLVLDKRLSAKVILTGELTDVNSHYLTSKIFAFTSSSEGFPNVISEALSAGLPVISYDCVAGPSEMITDGENGFLVPVYEDDMFIMKLKQMIADEELRQRMSANAPASVEKYSIETIGAKYLDFILS